MGAEGNTAVYRWSGRLHLLLGVAMLAFLAAGVMTSGDLLEVSPTEAVLWLCAAAAFASYRAWSRPFAIRVSEDAIELVYLLRRTAVVPRESALVDEVTCLLWGTRLCIRDRRAPGRGRVLVDTRYARRPPVRTALLMAGYQISNRMAGRAADG